MYFTKEQMNILRGWSMIIIAISHTVPNSGIAMRWILPSNIAIFIFSTGFGLLTSYQKRGEGYLNGFVVEKIIKKIFMPYVIVSIFKIFCNRLLNGGQIGRNMFVDWYVEFTLFVYICFYLIWRYARSGNGRVIWTGIATIGYLVLCLVTDKASTWYQGLLVLWGAGIAAVWLGRRENEVESFIRKNESILIGVALLFMYFTNALTFGMFHFPLSGTIGAEGVCLFTALSMLLVIPRMPHIFGITTFLNWLGRNSYSFYLMHMLVYQMIFGWVETVFSRCILTIVITVGIDWTLEMSLRICKKKINELPLRGKGKCKEP